MSFKERLSKNNKFKKETPNNFDDGVLKGLKKFEEDFQNLKERLCTILEEVLESDKNYSNYSQEKKKEFIANFIANEIIKNYSEIPLSKSDKIKLIKDIIASVYGFGPLEVLLENDFITSVFVNGFKNVYVEKQGKIVKTDVEFKDEEHLKKTIERVLARIDKNIDEKTLFISECFEGNLLVTISAPPLSKEWSISLKRLKHDFDELEKMVVLKAITPEIAKFLEVIVASGANIIISGGRGGGKTSLLNCLANKIPINERIITLEDEGELVLKHKNIVNFKANSKEKTLLLSKLHKMQPNRVLVDECSEKNVFDVINVMSSGFSGSMATICANTVKEAFAKLINFALLENPNLTEANIKKHIVETVDFIIQTVKLPNGERKIVKISEIVPDEISANNISNIFIWQKTSSKGEKINGYYKSTGTIPYFMKKAQEKGYNINSWIFEEDYRHKKSEVTEEIPIQQDSIGTDVLKSLYQKRNEF